MPIPPWTGASPKPTEGKTMNNRAASRGLTVLFTLVIAVIANTLTADPVSRTGERGVGPDGTPQCPECGRQEPIATAEANGAAGPRLLIRDIKSVIARAVHEARALDAVATIAVVDRVGNVLGVYRMNGTNPDVEIATTRSGEPMIDGGLEGIILPAAVGGDALAAIAKAITGAYLSTSNGNAFTTRTANQIVQEHFNPGEINQPSGPLFGVQFSQLACSDFTLAYDGGRPDAGPKRSPLGLSADPGGFPLYKNGVLVGGVGVMADGRYTIDKNILDFDRNVDEIIALAGTFGYEPPEGKRANRITVEGKLLRFSDVTFRDLPADPGAAPGFASLGAGAVIPVPGYSDGTLRRGTVFGQPASGVRPASDGVFPERDAFVFVDNDNANRYPPSAGTDASALTAEEVRVLLDEALGVANEARAQIRAPVDSQARVTIAVVDSNGAVLGMARTRDAPMFGSDVSLQKARTAALFSSRGAADFLNGVTVPTVYLDENLAPRRQVSIPDYVTAVKDFVGAEALSDGTAFSDRAGGNLSRPFFPDGIVGTEHGPFSKPEGEWSVFSTGLQLDLVMNGIVQHLGFVAGLPGFTSDAPDNCVGVELGAGDSAAPGRNIANGTQIFPGSVPIYRGDTLVGGIGISGDGVDQDDLVAFLGLDRAGRRLDGAIGNAPPSIRADRLEPKDVNLRYVQCPFAPFLGSSVQNACSGL